MSDTAKRLRAVILDIRRKPYPIADLIPLLDKADTELETGKKRSICDNFGRCNCTASSGCIG